MSPELTGKISFKKAILVAAVSGGAGQRVEILANKNEFVSELIGLTNRPKDEKATDRLFKKMIKLSIA